jgi:hypothetical protein
MIASILRNVVFSPLTRVCPIPFNLPRRRFGIDGYERHWYRSIESAKLESASSRH